MTTVPRTPLLPGPGTAFAGAARPRVVRLEPDAGAVTISRVLQMISIVLLVLVVDIVAISQVQHYAWQNSLYQDVRLHLAEGSVPTGPAGADGQVVAPGTPLAVFRAAELGIDHEVIVEGTASAQTMQGIGHLRSTALPCQVGTSVLMARASAYGGIGGAWSRLVPGQRFSVTMAQGACTYEVMGSRLAGDQAPPFPIGREGRLILTTASGAPFMPDGVLRIDTKLVTDAFDRPPLVLPDAALPASERAMGADSSGAFGLLLLLEVLVAAALGATWLWKRWGRWESWIVAVPVIATIGLLAATNVNSFLPNLL
ncbi:sortase family protein [Herbiconiux ginsengi]|uniref:Sortase A n=1 Tax=Herbiconiux ginsengi TaxID=381665 RepID=A0A1H3T4L1_9MICO|nr:hypothetical protein [Herbiconiux ginsengi]SDZ45196.1 sortase A [Herbiconiux ginsengi]